MEQRICYNYGMNYEETIYVAGHRGLAGSALVRALRARGARKIVAATHAELDLRDMPAVRAFFERERPAYVYLAAARVGGIEANRTQPYEFLRDNLRIQDTVLTCAWEYGVRKTLFLGSSCIYPRECPQPMKEEYLLTGPLEPTNEGYALAKIAGLRMAQYLQRQYGVACVCAMPCNLYGPGDTFDLQRAHVISALVKRFVDATAAGAGEVVLWGSGAARREFLHVDDMAEACLLLMERYTSAEVINVGSGTDVSIQELAELIQRLTGYRGRVVWDRSRPDGMPRKCLDISRIRALGFEPRIALEEGVARLIEEYKQQLAAQGACG